MSVANPQPLELIRVQTVKFHSNNPSQEFVNTWELQAADSPDLSLGMLNGVVDKIVDFEKTMSRTTIGFRRVVISTYEEELGGYDPAQFVSRDLEGIGAIAGGTADLPLEACLHVTRKVPTGRQGKLFIRGYLSENDVQSVSGNWRLADPSAVETDLVSAVNTSSLNETLGGADPFFIVMVGENTSGVRHVRTVQNLGVVGVAWVKLNHRYFNRGGFG